MRRDTLSIQKLRETKETKQAQSDSEQESKPGPWASLTADRRLSETRRAIEAKKEIRRQRKDLKESGDYLGVQGINPETGVLDIISPTESERSASLQADGKASTLQQVLKNAQTKYSEAVHPSGADELQPRSKHGKERIQLGRLYPNVKWRRHTKQWSSAQEPNLSPVAQSLKSGTPVSDPATPGQLVDLNIPDGGDLGEQELSTPQTSGDTSKTSLTVVHTPHRLSHAAISPAAVELFENGIEFNGESSVGKDKRGHTGPERAEKTPDGSFLGRQTLGTPGSQGNTKITPTRSIKDISSLKSLIATLDSQLQNQKDSLLPGAATAPNTQRTGHELLKNSKSADMIGEKAQRQTRERELQLTDRGSPLQKLSARIKSRQRSKKNLLATTRVSSLDHILRSVTNLKEAMTTTEASSKEDLGQAEELAQLEMKVVPTKTTDAKEITETTASDLGSQVSEVDKGTQSEWKMPAEDSVKDQGWNNWAQDVVQRMVERSEGVKDDPASTCITTTTGSGQTMSPSSQEREPQIEKRNSVPSSQSFSKSTPTNMTAGGKEYRMNHAPSTSLSCKLDQEIDTMSTATTEQKLSGIAQTDFVPTTECQHTHSISPMSILAMDRQKTNLTAKAPGLETTAILVQEKCITLRRELSQSQESTIQGPIAEMQVGQLLEPAERSTLHVEESLGKLMMSYPGSYPHHPDANDDIANLLSSLMKDMGSCDLPDFHLRPREKGVLVFCKEGLQTLQSVLQEYFRLFLAPYILPGPGPHRRVEDPNTILHNVAILFLTFPGACLAAWAFS
ncbi:unnamed protein product [Clonostachys rhizophaga]|uniref:Uncharacterized protein n=1 Tax=Clonostachys rhizophaga TaxID=160324 RepID=A0A9N9VUM5_9HYPO|nr:unnamed protein product [Clonostachys rhizophaga]